MAPTVQSQLVKISQESTASTTINSLISEKLTNCRTFVKVQGKGCLTILDTGAACNVISELLANNLGYKSDKNSNEMIVTADGSRHFSLGKITDLLYLYQGYNLIQKL
ncbi:hypothetical protein AX774_g6148 [Zancudomyces culisetae]|uniref:Uncharacterized protein n=1 Tax=Zancudomyces culisetae TaxID=1213189 RepID=A0A1R1PHJ5_ZANCU|nr:hypothetical protein AX774_g6148 [Zancudomyces culisetae]|eukprot:OMH80417.1 hypothetical protein AX774_g6148 [Zancudomyces culisetae]